MEAFDYIPSLHENRVTLFIYYAMRALVGLAALAFLWDGDMASAGGCLLVFLLMLVPSILKERYRLYLPFALDMGIVVFIFCTLFLGHMVSLYDSLPLWDKFLHFQSGLILSVTGFVLIYILNEHESTSLHLTPGFVALFAIVFSISIGTLWELGEFFGDELFGTDWSHSQMDTMWDLVADTVGAVAVSTVGYFWMRVKLRLPFTPLRFKKWGEKILKLKKEVQKITS